MSQSSSEILRGFTGKNSSTPMILLDDALVKLVPSARVEKIKEEIIRVAKSGDTKHLEMLLNAVLFDPAVAIFGGVGCQISTTVSTRTLDSRLDSTVARRVQEQQRQLQSENKEILFYIHTLISRRGRGTDDDEVITSSDLARERISFSIETTQGNSAEHVFATITIPSFRIRYDSPGAPSRSGVWQFPECTIGIQINATRISETQFKIAFSLTPYVLYPRNYLHPYVYTGDNKFCTGSFQNSSAERNLLSMDPINGIYHYLKQVANIFVNGYHENSAPARAHVYEGIFSRYKLYPDMESERIARIKEAEKQINDEVASIRRIIQSKRR